MTEAWIMCDEVADPRDEGRCDPNSPVSYEDLSELGITIRRFDLNTMLTPSNVVIGPGGKKETISDLEKYLRVNDYKISKNNDKVLATEDAFEEHLFLEDWMHLITEGRGYFDFRAPCEEEHWTRVLVAPGDLIIIPAGCYHRFTPAAGCDAVTMTHIQYQAQETTGAGPLFRRDAATEETAARVSYVRQHLLPRDDPARLPEYTIWSTRGPANGIDNIILSHPSMFDETMRAIIRDVHIRRDNDKKRFYTTTLRNKGSEIPYLIVLYFTGSHFPGLANKSWCPDCVVADPIVQAEMDAVSSYTASLIESSINPREKTITSTTVPGTASGTPTKVAAAAAQKPFEVSKHFLTLPGAALMLENKPFAHITFVECPLQRSPFLRNPEFPYRTHPFIGLKCIPTLMTLLVSPAPGFTRSPPPPPGAGSPYAGLPLAENEGRDAVTILSTYSDAIPEDWLTTTLKLLAEATK